MSNKWLQNIKHVAPGEPVKAGVVARPDRVLADRTEYLRQRLDAAALGRAIFDSEAVIASDVLPGQPVYWNETTQQYEKALAAVTTDPETGALLIQPSGDVVGVCYKKKSAQVGDIVLYGAIQLPEITNAINGPVVPGRYYLSSQEAGKITMQRPAATVAVCFVQGIKDNCADDPWIIVAPQVRDFLEEHVHYRFELVARPAGEHDPAAAADTGTHVIENADADLEGWLPAAHPIFRRDPTDPATNYAPAGAKFGYNFSQHAALQRVWPPLPLSAVAMLWDKGYDQVGATEIPLTGENPLCIVDANGIWWTRDCYGEVPWPADLDTDGLIEVSETPNSECPRVEAMRVIIAYIRLLYGNDRGYVTSLQPGPGSPITVTNCDGVPARTGDLELGLDLEYLVDPVEALGGQAFKELVEGFKLRKGWVTEGMIVGYGPIVLDGSRERNLTAAEKTALGLPGTSTVKLQQGIVKVSYDDQLVEREISPQIIRLADTVERLYQDIPYLGFPKLQDSLLRVRLNVPAANLGASLEMKIRVQLFGRTTGALPALTMTRRNISRPAVGGTLLPAADTPLTFTVPGGSLAADTVIEVESAPFVVAEGDTVLITLAREGTTDAYAADVGMLRMTGVVYVP